MITEQQIDNLTLKGEISIALFALERLSKEKIQKHQTYFDFIEHMKIWMKCSNDEQDDNTSIKLYKQYSDKMYSDISNATDLDLRKYMSLSYNLFLYILRSMEGIEYLLYPNKTQEPTSDVIEQDNATLIEDLVEINKIIFLENDLTTFYNKLFRTQEYSESNEIGMPIIL